MIDDRDEATRASDEQVLADLQGLGLQPPMPGWEQLPGWVTAEAVMELSGFDNHREAIVALRRLARLDLLDRSSLILNFGTVVIYRAKVQAPDSYRVRGIAGTYVDEYDPHFGKLEGASR